MKSRNLITSLALLALAATSLSCTEASSPADLNRQAEASLQELDYDAAKVNFEAAAAALGQDTASPDYKAAKLGVIECLVYTDDTRCAPEFTNLTADASDYVYISGLLSNAGHLESGFAVAELGNQHFPDHPGLVKVFENLAVKAKTVGSPALDESLIGLGYIE